MLRTEGALRHPAICLTQIVPVLFRREETTHPTSVHPKMNKRKNADESVILRKEKSPEQAKTP
jgi:hypothetical protein